MKQTKFIVLLILFVGLTVNLSAQVNKPSADEQEKQRLIEEFKKAQYARSQNMVQVQERSVTVFINKYNHHETEIKAKLVAENIPDEFPVYTTGYSDEQYIILMNKWYSANPSLLKKENTNEQK